MKTEFGRGYATCLYLFLGHNRRLARDLATYADLHAKGGDAAYLFTPERAVEMWASGAADHLAEIQAPKRGISREDIQRSKELRDRVWGAGRRYMGEPDMSPDEARRWMKAAQNLLYEAAKRWGVRYPRNVNEALEIDRSLGLTRADSGGYTSCFRTMRDGA